MRLRGPLLVCASVALLMGCANVGLVEPNPVPTVPAHTIQSPAPTPTDEPRPTETMSPTPTHARDGDQPDVQSAEVDVCPLTPDRMESVLGAPVESLSAGKYGNNDGRMCAYLGDVSVNLYTLPAGGSDATHTRAGHLARYSSDETLEIPGATDVILFSSPVRVHMVVDDSYFVVEMLVSEPEESLMTDVAIAVAQELIR